jgi:pimeloyl-ACP methyl ester carboxylesterase
MPSAAVPELQLIDATLARPDGAALAYDMLDGSVPTVVFIHGLNSDRRGTKADALAHHCAVRGYGLVRIDLFGHGQSTGRFQDGTISRWTDDALAIIDTVVSGPVVIVGSSMGGWVGLKAALARPQRVVGFIGIAAAPDFTEDLMFAHFTADQKAAIDEQGYVDLPSEYADQPYRISRELIEDGRRNLLLRHSIDLTCPVRLLHGQHDTSVPWQTAQRLADALTGPDVDVLLMKDGDHRLSRPQDLLRLCATVDTLIAQVRP